MKPNRVLLTVATVVSALLITSCGGGNSGDETGQNGSGDVPQTELRLGVLQEPQSWDPAQAHVGHVLQPYQAPYDSLLLREPDGTLVPMLATEWGYTDDANQVMELQLRTDVTFSDGAEFNADAVVANIEHFKQANGRQVGQAASIESVAATDADTVQINLSTPDPALEYYLSQALGLMGSPDALGTPELDRLPVGTGPYTMVADQSTVGNQYVFEAREDYWNPDLQHFSGITMRFLPEPTAMINALSSGEVDAGLVNAQTYEQAEGAGLTQLAWEVDWGGMTLYDRDGEVNEALGDVRVRQAINYALDREALLQEVAAGQGVTTSQVFGEDTTAFNPELDDYYAHDPDRARELLADAGYGDGLTLEMPVLTPGAETTMTFVTQQLGDVGITVQQTSVPSADYVSYLGQGRFSAAWFNLFQGPTWVAIEQIISTNALYNPFDSTTPEVEAWVEEIRTAGDDADQAAQDLNRYVTENAWFAPWYRMTQLYYYDADKLTVNPQVQMAVPSIYNYSPAG